MVTPESNERADTADAKRARSGIGFPYYDLDDAVAVTRAVFAAGGDEAPLDRLARELDHKSIESGAFRLRLAAANMFGLIDSGGGRARLTDRARAILSMHPEDVQQAMAAAFLAVPLFNAIYSRYQGRQLPPEAGLKHVIRELGVVTNQVDRAHGVLRRSAQAAGFSASGENYLVAPPTRPRGRPTAPPEREGERAPAAEERAPAGGGAPPPTGIHPALMGLLQVLPAIGTPWRRGKREWLNAFTATVNVLYPDGDDTEAGGDVSS